MNTHCVYIETPRDNYLTHIIAECASASDAAREVRTAITDRPTEHGHAGIIWPDGRMTDVRF